MKLPFRILLANLLMLVFSLACVSLVGGAKTPITNSDDLEFYIPTTTPASAVVSCPVITDEAIRLALVENDAARNASSRDSVYLVRYFVSEEGLTAPSYGPGIKTQDLKKYQNDKEGHNRIWKYFTSLIPLEQRTFLNEFIILTDGKHGLLAAVKQTEDDPEKWVLLVDVADTSNAHELTYTLTHEFAHLLTLNPAQVPPSLAIFKDPKDRTTYFHELAACFTYFPGEGCSNPGSYIDDFYDQFWLDIYDEWNKIEFETDSEEYYQEMEAFYAKYKDRFVTDYAVTRPAEDIAESFTFFILSEKPDGDTIAEQKVLFFYNHPELVALREVMLKNVCENFPQ